MAIKVVDTELLESGITATANAIRQLTGAEEKIAWDNSNGMAQAINNIQTYSTEYHNLIDGAISTITFPENTSLIRDGICANCTQLTQAILPETVTQIGDYSFKSCSSLTDINLPNSITSIGKQAFFKCSSLEILNLPDSLEQINEQAFSNTSNIMDYIIPASVTTIEDYAFANCDGLISVTFKGTPSLISQYAFNNNNFLVTLNVPWSEGEVANAPWGATEATINYNYTDTEV